MEFAFDAEQEAFRAELCAFLDAELPDEVREQHRDLREWDGWEAGFAEEFRRRLGARGYIAAPWPTEYGGGGRDIIDRVIFAEEMEYHGAPAFDRSVTYIPDALLQFGSEAQKRELLPRLGRGECTFFLGYSEPDAGSDLAGLQTRAEERGDTFVITGQKAYSSGADRADYGWVAARTDPDAPKHRGISLFIVDMTSPGIEIARHATTAGWEHHSVAFNGVEVPRSALVGELNEGWRVIMGAIDAERASLGAPGLVLAQLDRLVAHARETPAEDAAGHAGTLLEDGAVADRLARLAIEVDAAQLVSYWVASLVAHGERGQHEASLALLYKRETARALDVAALELLGPAGALQPDAPGAPLGGAVEREYLDHLYFHFAAGGFDINRNVIATRGLGLPRG